MNIGSERDSFVRLKAKLGESIFEVHQIVKRKSRIDARRGKNLEERRVIAVRRVAIACAAKVAASYPGFDFRCELIACFNGYRACVMAEAAPVAELPRSPEQNVGSSFSCPDRADEVTAQGGEAYVFAVTLTHRHGTIICFDRAAPVVIVNGESSRFALRLLARKSFRQRAVVEIHVKFFVGVQLKDAFRRTRGNEREVMSAEIERVQGPIEASLNMREAERPDQSLREVVAFERGKRRIDAFDFVAIREFEPPDLQTARLAS